MDNTESMFVRQAIAAHEHSETNLSNDFAHVGVEHLHPEELRAYARVHFALMASLGPSAKAGERSAAAAILAYEGRFLDGEAYPSVRTLGDLAGLCERAMHDKLDKLLDKERIRMRTRLGCSTVYRVQFPGKPEVRRRRLASAESAPPARSADDQRVSLSFGERDSEKKAAAGSTAAASTSSTLPDRAAASQGNYDSTPTSGEPSAHRDDLPPSPRPLCSAPNAPSGPRARTPKRAKPLAPPRPFSLPNFAPALLSALCALPAGRSAVHLLAASGLPAEAAERVAQRVLDYDRTEREAGRPGVQCAGAFIRGPILDAQAEHDAQAEQQEAKKHDYVPPETKPATAKPARRNEPSGSPPPRPDPLDAEIGAVKAMLSLSWTTAPRRAELQKRLTELEEALRARQTAA